jgi:hypothetical protein
VKPSRRASADQADSGFDRLAVDKLTGREAVSLPDLVSDLSRDLGYTADGVTKGLLGLQSRKVIVITEKTPYASFSSYVASPISLWFWGAVGATVLSVAFVFVNSGLTLYLRYAFGGLLILFLPGYSLLEMLYPKKDLDELARFGLSIGLSLALVPLVGLALNYTPLGIRLLPVVFSLSGLTLVFLVVALGRKHAHYKAAKEIPRAMPSS